MDVTTIVVAVIGGVVTLAGGGLAAVMTLRAKRLETARDTAADLVDTLREMAAAAALERRAALAERDAAARRFQRLYDHWNLYQAWVRDGATPPPPPFPDDVWGSS